MQREIGMSTQKKDHVRTQREDDHLQGKGRLQEKPILLIPLFCTLAYRIVRK